MDPLELIKLSEKKRSTLETFAAYQDHLDAMDAMDAADKKESSSTFQGRKVSLISEEAKVSHLFQQAIFPSQASH